MYECLPALHSTPARTSHMKLESKGYLDGLVRDSPERQAQLERAAQKFMNSRAVKQARMRG